MYNSYMEAVFNLTPLTPSDLILFITAIIVWIYTRAAQKANELQESPCVILSFQETTQPNNSSRDGKIRIKNIGKGPAYDINILPFITKEGEKIYTYTFYTESRTLKPSEEDQLKMWIKTQKGVESSEMRRFLFRIIPETLDNRIHDEIQAERPALFIVNYKGLNGKKYHSIYRLYSILPPVGDIVIQSLHHGKHKAGFVKARWYHLKRPGISHEGNNEPPKITSITKLLSFLYKKFH